MNDPHPFRGDRPIDFSRLNDSEQRVLRLLAEGHTAKTIATALDTTPAAVNERLREARRKTGVGSSRELARMLKAQENCHEEIGVGKRRTSIAPLPQSAAEPWRPQTGVLAMLAIMVVALSAAALMSQAPAANNEIDPLIGAPLPNFANPADWHARVRMEQRDPDWAPRVEDLVRTRVLQIPLIGKNGNVLRVTCRSTLCEIAGTVIAPVSKREEEDQRSPFNQAIRDLQVSPLPDDLAKIGLKSEGGTFTGGKDKPDRTVFLVYYSRAEPKPK